LTIDHDPMNRLCLPENIAEAIVWLVSDGACAIHGVALRIGSGRFIMGI